MSSTASRISLGLLSAISGLSVADATLAADMPLKARPAPAPVVARWSGFYLGGHVGGAWAGADPWTVASNFPGNFDPLSFANPGDSSFVGGLQAGYNWQFNSNWVAGVEGDVSWLRLSESVSSGLTLFGIPRTPASLYNTNLRRDVNWLSSVRGRFGYATDLLLIYATGGVAWGNVEHFSTTFNGLTTPFAASDSQTATGYVVGGGLEYALTSNWSMRGEYLFYHLNSGVTLNAGLPPPILSSVITHFDDAIIHTARFGLNYRFGP